MNVNGNENENIIRICNWKRCGILQELRQEWPAYAIKSVFACISRMIAINRHKENFMGPLLSGDNQAYRI